MWRVERATTLTGGTTTRAYCDACLALHVRAAKALGEVIAVLDVYFDVLSAACADDPEHARTVGRAIEHVDAFFTTFDTVHLYAAFDIVEEGIPPGRRPDMAALASAGRR